MAQRKKLGLVFKYDESWVAGSYYIINLIYALKELDDNKKPEIVVFIDYDQDKTRIKSINYPYLTFKKYIPVLNAAEKIVNKLSRLIAKKNWIEKRVRDNDIDYLFMIRRSWETDLLSNSKKIFWIPDCQQLLMPEFFFERELSGRKHVYNEIITAKSKILFSSNAAKADFKSFYPQAQNEMHVVNFAVTHPNISTVNFESLKKKFNISGNYFMVTNQFWVHKNHKVVLEAVLLLKQKGIAATVVFTGKENDFRAPEYTQELKKYVADNELSENTLFLGFIDRAEQLCLMKNSLAVIQPSLFEGWSTVVEDAKALNKWVILSDIAVHREQIESNVSFFNPRQANELAAIIENSQHTGGFKEETKPYENALLNFAEGFANMLR